MSLSHSGVQPSSKRETTRERGQRKLTILIVLVVGIRDFGSELDELSMQRERGGKIQDHSATLDTSLFADRTKENLKRTRFHRSFETPFTLFSSKNSIHQPNSFDPRPGASEGVL
jgi:hypothetical protein